MHVLEQFMCSKDGFSSAGLAVALLLACALVFSGVHIYIVMDESNQVQHVADVAAQAAGHEVCAYITTVRICDAALLSMSLTSITLAGIGIVCCCVPSAQSVGTKCIEASQKIVRVEEHTADCLVKFLNSMQQALPILSQAQVTLVATENSNDDVAYRAVTELVPNHADLIQNPFDESMFESIDEVADDAQGIQDKSTQVQESYDKAQEALRQGYLHDCGNAPGPCMYERASVLSDILIHDNPLVHSQNTWSFQIPLDRAIAYYKSRAAEEVPGPGNFDEKIKSILRARFYDYMYQELQNVSVQIIDGEIESIQFPDVPTTKEQIMKTSMYTDKVYPVSAGIENLPLLHVWSGCPYCDAPYEKGSLEQLDDGVYDVCPGCALTTAQLARVAAITSSVESGFEYHYKKVAEAADVYSKAMREVKPLEQEVKQDVQQDLDILQKTAQSLNNCRIEVYPAGNCGAVVAVAAHYESDIEVLPFSKGLACRDGAAISGVTIVDNSDESVLEGVQDTIGSKLGIESVSSGLSFIGDVWTWTLDIYAKGINGSADGIRNICDSLPLVSSSGLGSWAQEALLNCIAGIGFKPANISKPKVAVVNSLHVAKYGDGVLSEALRRMKSIAEAGQIWTDDS